MVNSPNHSRMNTYTDAATDDGLFVSKIVWVHVVCVYMCVAYVCKKETGGLAT